MTCGWAAEPGVTHSVVEEARQEAARTAPARKQRLLQGPAGASGRQAATLATVASRCAGSTGLAT